MLLPITAIAASILVLGYVALSLYVINLRRTGAGPSVGMTGDERFTRAVRAHGNLSEYAPLFLILLGLSELHESNTTLLIAVTIVFIVGRFIHAIGFGLIGRGPGRTLGMVATNGSLITLALTNLLLVL